MIGLSSCSDSFLEDKKNYQYVGPEIYQDYSGCLARVDNIYYFCLPDMADANYRYNAVGLPDAQSGSTEEYVGFTDFINPDKELSALAGSNEVPDFFQNVPNNIQAMPYGYIRLINDAIEGISGSTGISDSQKNELLGQCYFFRAWQYYKMFKWYGGLPLVDKVLEPEAGSDTDRSTSKETFNFIMNDLNEAVKRLSEKTYNGGWQESSNYGRVTTAAALALKGRLLTLWCSPMFNRKGDEQRYKDAYAIMKLELDSIKQGGYHLYEDNTAGKAYAFAKMFTLTTNNPEAIFFTQFNTSMASSTKHNNSWEGKIRPSNTTGSGLTPSSMIVDMFPMSDGKIPASAGGNASTAETPTYTKLESSTVPYDKYHPFMNRDPRFYRTFAFPGVVWAYSGDATQANPDNPSYSSGTKYELWNYVWYANKENRDKFESTGCYGGDNLLSGAKGMYVRKRSDDYEVNKTPLYDAAADKTHIFPYSSAPLIEIRFAEVLLNLAEVACGAGDTQQALEYLREIRKRVGYTGDCGLSSSLEGDRGACMSAVLYERQIELAYEGKRFDDMRRWMLFDGGTEKVSGAPSTWDLGGMFAGGMKTFLGFEPLNDKYRETMFFAVKDDAAHNYGLGKTTKDSDPLLLKGLLPPEGTAVNLNQDDATVNASLTNLRAWYNTNLERLDKKGDALDSNNERTKRITFRPNYYFLGFKSGALDHNKTVKQTIGWYDTNTKQDGTFDPLAE